MNFIEKIFGWLVIVGFLLAVVVVATLLLGGLGFVLGMLLLIGGLYNVGKEQGTKPEAITSLMQAGWSEEQSWQMLNLWQEPHLPDMAARVDGLIAELAQRRNVDVTVYVFDFDTLQFVPRNAEGA